MSEFTTRVLAAVRRIPVGKVATYGDVAEAAGRPGAARAVGNIMRDCRQRDVPCHRVIAAAGKLGGYGGNLELKRGLLRAEGILVGRSSIRNFTAHRARLSSRSPSTRLRSALAQGGAGATRKPHQRLMKQKGRKLR
jgi:methylated-DNA-[protein]-cysteine S-methyltransferase